MSMEEAFHRQRAFTGQFLDVNWGRGFEKLTEDDKVALTKEYFDYITVEMVEVLNCTSWKRHRHLKPSSREALLNELIDVQKYLWGLMQIWGINIPDIERAFKSKSSIVERRFKQEHLLPKLIGNNELVVVDIDGTVADWDNGFTEWALRSHPSYTEDDFAKHVNPGLREQLKSNFYDIGGMATLPPIEGAVDAVNKLMTQYTVVWLSARRVTDFPRIEHDTLLWLEKHGLPTKYIYWSDLNKHQYILEQFPLAKALFDDEPEVVQRAKEFGIQTYMISTENSLSKAVEQFSSTHFEVS